MPNATAEVVWVHKLLDELGIPHPKAAEVVRESKVGAASGGGVDANGGWRSNDAALGGDVKQNKTYDDDVSPSDQV